MKNLLTGHLGYLGTEIAKRLPDFQGCDLRDGGADYRLIKGGVFNTVVHLAAYVSVTDSLTRPDAYFENNAYGLRDFLRNNHVRRLVFASSGGVLYGNCYSAREHDAALVKCETPYAQSKFLAEDIVRGHCVNHCILRLANVIGGEPQLRSELSCEGHFLVDNPIVVYGGEQARDFIYIGAVAAAIRRAATDPSINGTFNIGSGEPTSVLDFAQRLARQRGVPLEIRSARAGELDHVTLNVTRARRAGLL